MSMMTTEEEAIGKACCGPPALVTAVAHLRFVLQHPASERGQLNMSGDPTRLCQGARCMAWRWKGPTVRAGAGTIERTGYCGLVGEPSQ